LDHRRNEHQSLLSVKAAGTLQGRVHRAAAIMHEYERPGIKIYACAKYMIK
jgi:hypothetical protein